jgi:hypothetical protein
VKNLFELYIIHYSPLKERRTFLEVSLPQALGAQWITESDVKAIRRVTSSAWTSSKTVFGVSPRRIGVDLRTNIKSFVKSRRAAYIESIILSLMSYLPLFPNRFRYGGIPKWKEIPYSAKEVMTMHLEAISRALQSGKEWALILEDDAVPNHFNMENLKGFLLETKSSKPIWINLNSGQRLVRTSSDPSPDRYGFFRVRPPATRCATAYLINRAYMTGFESLLKHHPLPNWLGIDFVLQVANRKLRAKSYWTEPVMFLQGSETGKYSSNHPSPK